MPELCIIASVITKWRGYFIFLTPLRTAAQSSKRMTSERSWQCCSRWWSFHSQIISTLQDWNFWRWKFRKHIQMTCLTIMFHVKSVVMMLLQRRHDPQSPKFKCRRKLGSTYLHKCHIKRRIHFCGFAIVEFIYPFHKHDS